LVGRTPPRRYDAREVGRPRKRHDDETAVLSFRVRPELVRALDDEAARQSKLQDAWRPKLSRSDVVKLVLYGWLDEQRKNPPALPPTDFTSVPQLAVDERPRRRGLPPKDEK
jgi:hypothetical protein